MLGQKASERDLIVVQDAWEGIRFDRYYHGRSRWVTVPPIDSHKVHRTDLVMEKLSQQDPMAPILREITGALRGSNSVWLVETVPDAHPNQLPPRPSLPSQWWLGSYLVYWNAQVMVLLQNNALREGVLDIPVNGPVSSLENLSVLRFSG